MNRKGLLTILVLFGFLFATFFLFVLLVLSTLGDDLMVTGDSLGVVEIVGPITDSKEVVEQLERYEDNAQIKGILVRVDSPGGAVAPSQEIHDAVIEARKKKKVVISMGTVAASGGYYIACAGDKIYANPGTVTGSIGVITQLTNLTELADLAHLDMITVKSGKYKDTGNPFRAFEEDDRQFFEQMILNIYEQFIRDVAEGRKMDLDKVRALADGRVYTGEQAKELGLVDELGSMQAAARWLGEDVGITGRPKLVYPPKKDEEILRKLLESSVSGAVSGVSEGVRTEAAPRFEYRYLGPQ